MTLLLLIIAAMFSYGCIAFLIQLAKRKNWMDVPDPRKSHSSPTPRLGGLGILMGISLPLFWTIYEYLDEYYFVLVSFFIVFLTGLLDDIRGLRVHVKFIMESVAALILIKGGLQFPLEQFIPFTIPGYLQTFISLLFIVGTINAFNLIDGINGLLASLALIGFISFGVFYQSANPFLFHLCLFYGAGISGFLLHNFRYKASIFMGDGGSLIIGFWMSVLFLYTETVSPSETFSMAFPISILAIPLLDMARVVVVRLIQSKSPFSPDKSHLHHLFLRCQFSHVSSSSIIGMLAVMIIVVSLYFDQQPVWIFILCICLLSSIILSVLFILKTQYADSDRICKYDKRTSIQKLMGESKI
ncbi:MAG: undecaprenyl/decaprenyl-phosphate alpha-N-acetylglucosaminyl 1-phosphate transferase [Cytophagaceae bacterium]|jgi:UDP-N-acetylmuramyl pentapeptide phosphotransferase/UDP-N-acetylglucosamine-1-phosphate transferase|nr:undecaprenyl/decaprenyl-phosphate alpha-N-acetylglucosaminyl 1-phosphate transferase [Cytophagaceae bacterium]